MQMSDLYPVGAPLVLGSLTFTAEDIIRFAEQFDPQPFHTDAQKARDTMFGALCASGWHSCAGWMKCLVAFHKAEAHRLIAEGKTPPRLGPSPGFDELQWLKPVFAGDTITYTLTPVESRPLKSRPGLLLNRGVAGGVNQKGEPVLRFNTNVIEYA